MGLHNHHENDSCSYLEKLRNRNCFRQSCHKLPLVPDFSNLFHSLSDPFFACLLYFKFTFKGLR